MTSEVLSKIDKLIEEAFGSAADNYIAKRDALSKKQSVAADKQQKKVNKVPQGKAGVSNKDMNKKGSSISSNDAGYMITAPKAKKQRSI